MVQIPVGNGIRMGLPFLMYGHSPAAITLVIISVVCLILVILLLFLGAYTNKRSN